MVLGISLIPIIYSYNIVMRKEKKTVICKYRYNGKEHTLVRFEDRWEKHLIKHWEEFESSLSPKNFRTYFTKLSETSNSEETKEDKKEDTENLDIVELTKQYINKFWNTPDKRWWVKTILEKLK